MNWVGDHYAGGSLDKRLSQSYCRSVKSAAFGSIAVTGGAFARLVAGLPWNPRVFGRRRLSGVNTWFTKRRSKARVAPAGRAPPAEPAGAGHHRCEPV